MLKLLENSTYEKTENDFCSLHKERLKHYCFTCDKPLCVVCAHYENHIRHEVMAIRDVVENEEKIKQDLQLKLHQIIAEVDANMNFFKTVKDTLER